MNVKFYLPLLFLCYVLHNVASEESITLSYEKTELRLDLFNTSVVHRQNFCEEQERYQRGELEINFALQGRHLNVALGPDDIFVKRNPDGSLNNEYPGLMPVLMDEVARRGKFTWRDSFIIHSSNVPSDKTWTDLLMWIVDSYDVAVWWWFALHSREALGASFPTGWYDGSIVIVARQESDFETFSPFSWSKPFTSGVWGLLLFTMIITGVIGVKLDPQEKKEKEKVNSSFLSGIYLSSVVFTGHLDLHPSTHTGRILSFSLSFFAMLMLSAYTANLASFLVIEKASLALQVNTVNDIVRNQKTMCVYTKSATQESIANLYPNAHFLERDDDLQALLSLKYGECDYAVLGLSSWEDLEKTSKVNGECNLVRIGRKFKEFEAGFATRSDAGTYCTSLVRDVINNHMNRMVDEGFIERAWEEHRTQTIKTTQCIDGAMTGTKEDVDVLGIINLGGIFLFHYSLVIVAIFVAVASKYYTPREYDSKEYNEEEIKEAPKNPEFVTGDISEIMKVELTAILDERLSRVEDQMFQIAYLLKHTHKNEVDIESFPINLEVDAI